MIALLFCRRDNLKDDEFCGQNLHTAREVAIGAASEDLNPTKKIIANFSEIYAVKVRVWAG